LLIEQKHYLASAQTVGKSLRYEAEIDGQWVGLLCFSAASLHLKSREKWIGWSNRQRTRRLGLVVNNSRYLILLERERVPNLASRVLGLALKRLSDDWLEHWGQPVLVVESFVGESRYRGVCYRACGFESAGLTSKAHATLCVGVCLRGDHDGCLSKRCRLSNSLPLMARLCAGAGAPTASPCSFSRW